MVFESKLISNSSEVQLVSPYEKTLKEELLRIDSIHFLVITGSSYEGSE